MNTLKDMKLSAAEKSARKETMSKPVAEQGPQYPYGLELRLDKDSIGKLGLDGYKVGDECMLTAKGKVVAVEKSEREGSGSGERHNITIQLTHMGAESAKKPLADAPMQEYAARRKMGEKA